MNAAKTIQGWIDDDPDLSQRKLAERVGVHHATIRRWDEKDRLDDEQKQKIADALGIDPEDVIGQAERDPESGWVKSQKQVERWRDEVVASEPDQWELITLMALPSFLDDESWVVSVTPKAIADHMGDKYEIKQFEEVWDDVLASDLVDRVGRGRWTLRIIIPDD